MWERLKRIWALGDYEVATEVYDTEGKTRPVLKNVDAKPRGMATIVDMDKEEDFEHEVQPEGED